MPTLLEPPTILAAGKPPFEYVPAGSPGPAKPVEPRTTGDDEHVETETETESGDA